MRPAQNGRRAHLLIVRQIAVQAPRGLIGRMPEQLLGQTGAGRFHLRGGHGAFFRADERAEVLFLHMYASRGCLPKNRRFFYFTPESGPRQPSSGGKPV